MFNAPAARITLRASRLRRTPLVAAGPPSRLMTCSCPDNGSSRTTVSSQNTDAPDATACCNARLFPSALQARGQASPRHSEHPGR